MKRNRRQNLLIESPASATGDIAFNLIVFFFVCASVQPDSGRKQTLPKSETVEEQKETENLKVDLTRDTVSVNSEAVPINKLKSFMKRKLEGKTTPEDRVVIVQSKKDVPYSHWIKATSLIEDAGGIITLQLEEERTVQLPD
ncbi:MAG: biopolymer transporter ExbD [Planctomycetaceae bacterium]|nr:biopolymer transporter ExbD [Planctomycetaceae bacterium]